MTFKAIIGKYLAFGPQMLATGNLDFFKTLIENLGTGVLLLGVAMAAVGGIQYGMAHSADDAAKKTSAMHTIVGGVIVGVIGIVIMPLIKDYIPTI